MLLGYNVAKAPTSPRNSTWFTRPFLLVRGWGLGTRLTVLYLCKGTSVIKNLDLALPFSVQLTTREQQALCTRSKYFRGGLNISKYLDRAVRAFRGSKYFVTGQQYIIQHHILTYLASSTQ